MELERAVVQFRMVVHGEQRRLNLPEGYIGRVLDRFLDYTGNIQTIDLNGGHIRAFIGHVVRHNTGRVSVAHFAVIRAFYGWLTANCLVMENPIHEARPSQKKLAEETFRRALRRYSSGAHRRGIPYCD
jgi:site-specific recombinase XerD